MHGIAATKFGPKRLDIFWTDPNFQVLQRTWDGTRWLGWYELSGAFSTVPAAVAWMSPSPLVISVGDLDTTITTVAAGTGGTGGRTGVHGGAGEVVTSAGSAHVREERVAATGAGGTSHAGGSTSAVGESERQRQRLDFLNGPVEQRIDLFAVGHDYAMYAKTLWGAGDNNRGAWFNLGGIFTSAPAAIVWDGGHGNRIDLFGLGTDHSMFQKTSTGSGWTPTWTRLGGTFSSAASLVSWGTGRLDVFARGTDFTLRHRAFNGSTWLNDWQNLGGSLASEPVAISWGPDRLDVFAIFHDGMLWHRWWDGMIWNDWESLGGRNATGGTFTAAPTAVTWAKNRMDVFATGDDGVVYHFWWDQGAWAGPEAFQSQMPMTSAPTAITIQPDWLDVFAPGTDKNVYHRQFNGSAWSPVLWDQLGGHIRLPSRYRFSVDFVTVRTTRSLNADTDTGSATIGAGNWPSATVTQSMGDIGGTHPSQAQTNLLHFQPVAVELCEAAIFSYLVVNNGNADQKKLDDALVKAGGSLTDDAVKSVSQDLGAGVGAIAGVTIGGIAAPIIGSLLGALVGWLMDQLGGVVFANCDGLVAAALIPKLGRDLDMWTAHGPHQETTSHPGTDSATGCGSNSVYEVTWSITRV